jgi:hypothetical protein
MLKHKRGRKENVVKRLFEREGLSFVHDTRVDDGDCLGTRPDFRFELADRVVVTEVDEYAHNYGKYTPECETTRMKNMVHSTWLPHIFIRYNPDTYCTDGHTFDPSPRERHRVLLDTLHRCFTMDTSALRTVYLFYDGYREKDELRFSDVDVGSDF